MEDAPRIIEEIQQQQQLGPHFLSLSLSLYNVSSHNLIA